MYKGRTIAATPPDRQETWQLRLGPTSLSLHAAFWDDLVCSDAQPGAPTFSTVLIHDGLPGAKRSFFTVRRTVMPQPQRSRHHIFNQNKAFRWKRSGHLEIVDASSAADRASFLCFAVLLTF
jgi:hypothetical protein